MIRLSLTALILSTASCIASANAALINVAVARLVTFSFELVNIISEIDVQNNNEILAKSYEFYVDPDVEIYHINFTDKYENQLFARKHPKENIYVVQFLVPLKYLGRTSITVKQTHVNRLKSWYKSRKFNEGNVMQYSGNVMYYSKYTTQAVATQYYAGKMSFLTENGFSLSPTSFTNKSIAYMFAEKVPFSVQNLQINFACNFNFFRILTFDRTVDISMYGMIEIIDNIVLMNNGPKLVGPFEPSFTRDHMVFTTPLPNGAHSIKYYDDIGLIKSYELNIHKDELSFDCKPRYPLYGGWKVSYSLKYLIPIYNNVQYSKEDGSLELNISVFGQVLKNVLIENAKAKVLLPEGSSILAVKPGSDIVRRGNRRVFSSLSLNGRMQVEFDGKNILDYYDTNVTIRFKQHILYFLRAPLQIICHLFALFLIVIFVRRYKTFGSF